MENNNRCRFLCRCLVLQLFLGASVLSSYSQSTITKTAYGKYCDTSFVEMTPYHILAFRDHDAALKCARQMKRPVLVYFSGMHCVNARKMESSILNDKEVKAAIENNYVFADLLCNDRTPVARAKQRYSKTYKKRMVTRGDVNLSIQADIYTWNTQPCFIVLGKDGKQLASQHYTTSPQEFLATLKKGIGK